MKVSVPGGRVAIGVSKDDQLIGLDRVLLCRLRGASLARIYNDGAFQEGNTSRIVEYHPRRATEGQQKRLARSYLATQ